MNLTLKTLLLTFGVGMATFVNAKPIQMEIWKSPTCGCCNDWIDHMKQNGFEVKINETGNREAHQKFNIDNKLASCHTAVVDGYVVEGHVPADDVKRLLAEKPDAVGLTAPGMPVGSPGMDGEVYQGRKDPYDVILIKKDGNHQIFNSHNAPQNHTQDHSPNH